MNNKAIKFIKNIEKRYKLDATVKNLIKTEVSNTSLNYPYGCDTNQYLHKAAKLRKSGNINEAI